MYVVLDNTADLNVDTSTPKNTFFTNKKSSKVIQVSDVQILGIVGIHQLTNELMPPHTHQRISAKYRLS